MLQQDFALYAAQLLPLVDHAEVVVAKDHDHAVRIGRLGDDAIDPGLEALNLNLTGHVVNYKKSLFVPKVASLLALQILQSVLLQ